jgi:hypothetical protein
MKYNPAYIDCPLCRVACDSRTSFYNHVVCYHFSWDEKLRTSTCWCKRMHIQKHAGAYSVTVGDTNVPKYKFSEALQMVREHMDSHGGVQNHFRESFFGVST